MTEGSGCAADNAAPVLTLALTSGARSRRPALVEGEDPAGERNGIRRPRRCAACAPLTAWRFEAPADRARRAAKLGVPRYVAEPWMLAAVARDPGPGARTKQQKAARTAISETRFIVLASFGQSYRPPGTLTRSSVIPDQGTLYRTNPASRLLPRHGPRGARPRARPTLSDDVERAAPGSYNNTYVHTVPDLHPDQQGQAGRRARRREPARGPGEAGGGAGLDGDAPAVGQRHRGDPQGPHGGREVPAGV